VIVKIQVQKKLNIFQNILRIAHTKFCRSPPKGRWSAKLKVENVLFMMILSVFLNFTIFDVRPNHFPVLRTFYQHNSSIPDISLCCCQFMQPVNHSMRLFFVSRQCRLTHRLLSAKRTSSSANNCLGVQRHVFLLLAL
jgi:hypothetical protein